MVLQIVSSNRKNGKYKVNNNWKPIQKKKKKMNINFGCQIENRRDFTQNIHHRLQNRITELTLNRAAIGGIPKTEKERPISNYSEWKRMLPQHHHLSTCVATGAHNATFYRCSAWCRPTMQIIRNQSKIDALFSCKWKCCGVGFVFFVLSFFSFFSYLIHARLV